MIESRPAERIALTVNGKDVELNTDPTRSLLDVLRDDLDLTGAKRCCDDGECGSCVVLLGSKGVMSCLLPVARAQNKDITTVEGLVRGEILDNLQEAFIECGATQCGVCIPGMIMEAKALLTSNPSPTKEDVVKRLSRNLCRCTGYVKIVDAVLYAAELGRGITRKPRPTLDTEHIVGQSVLRLDARDKVTGAAKYAADLKMEGMLWAKILRSPYHHAVIRRIDTSAAEALLGVEAVVTVKDIPGEAKLPAGRPQVTLLAQDRVRFVGEAVAAVAAVSEDIAAMALDLIDVDYEELPAVFDPLEAASDDAPKLFPPQSNMRKVTYVTQGDVEKAFAEADVTVESVYNTPTWEHAYMETEAGLAYFDQDSMLIVRAPQHHPFRGHDFLAAMLGVDRGKVRLICPTMGGNFGGRGDFLASGVIALLAFKTGKPVKIVYTREESLLGSSKGFNFHMKYKTAATKDGKLLGMKAELYGNGGSGVLKGVGASSDDNVASSYCHSTGPYYIPNVHIDVYEVYTNRPRSVNLRGGFGSSMALAYESQMDLLAARLGIDPFELRMKNALEVGERTHMGQVLLDSVGVKPTLNALKEIYQEAMAWAGQQPSSPNWKRGVGIGCTWYGIGGGGATTKSAVELQVDGCVRLLAGAVEKGQGVTTIIAQIAAEELKVPLDSLVISIGDTVAAPYRFETTGQQTTIMVGGSLQKACQNLKKALTESAAEVLEENPESISFQDGFVFSNRSPDEKLSFKQLAEEFSRKNKPMRYEGSYGWQHFKKWDPEAKYGSRCDVLVYGTQIAEVEVNLETGQVKVPKVAYAIDSGKIINPLAFEGQVEGGVIMGLGLALSEKFVPGGTRTLKSYGIPSTRDMPAEFTVLSVGEPAALGGPFGAKSVGTTTDMAAMSAVVNGIASATGVRIYDLPASRNSILKALNISKPIVQTT